MVFQPSEINLAEMRILWELNVPVEFTMHKMGCSRKTVFYRQRRFKEAGTDANLVGENRSFNKGKKNIVTCKWKI